jgi:hypothetical protein
MFHSFYIYLIVVITHFFTIKKSLSLIQKLNLVIYKYIFHVFLNAFDYVNMKFYNILK